MLFVGMAGLAENHKRVESTPCPLCTANASELIEKYFLKSRKYWNIFLKTRKINSLRKIFLSLLQENLTEIKNISQNRTNFLDIKKTFVTKKIFLILRLFS